MRVFAKVIPSSLKHLARTWIDEIKFERKLRRATPVLIFQMGKVGSLSVHNSLARQYQGAVVHAHRFDINHKNLQIQRLHRWALSENKPVNVISLTREPVSRNVSAFFQCFERETGVAPADSTFSHDELKSIFLARFDHDLPLQWFDRNIREFFDIDVFAAPFPAEGIRVFKRDRVRLLVLKSEINDAQKERAVTEFLGLPGFHLENTNCGIEKNYASLYAAFKGAAKLPSSYLDRMCTSRYFTHFYDQATRDSVHAVWCE